MKCVWIVSGDCEGKVNEVSIFNSVLKVPICEGHLRDHKEIMFLHSVGENIEEVVAMNGVDRKALYEKKRKEFPDTKETM